MREANNTSTKGSVNGKRFFQFKLISEDDEWYQSLGDDLKEKCRDVCKSLKMMSNTLLSFCYKHNVAKPNTLGQAKSVHNAALALFAQQLWQTFKSKYTGLGHISSTDVIYKDWKGENGWTRPSHRFIAWV